MAHIHGAASSYPTLDAWRRFRRIAMVVVLSEAVLGAVLGGFIVFVSMGGNGILAWPIVLFVLATCVIALWRLNREMKRYDDARRGEEGEKRTRELLDRLSDQYHVIHSVRPSAKGGDIDHVVVGPTGVFCMDTKNWRGTISDNRNGELLWNGKQTNKPQIRRFTARVMELRDVTKLNGASDPYFQAVFVFPMAYLDVKKGRVGAVDCIREDQLLDHVMNKRRARRLLDQSQVLSLANVLKEKAPKDAQNDSR